MNGVVRQRRKAPAKPCRTRAFLVQLAASRPRFRVTFSSGQRLVMGFPPTFSRFGFAAYKGIFSLAYPPCGGSMVELIQR